MNNWTPPEGTSPERAAEIRAELQSIVSRYNPAPGQPVDQAMAQLQYQFDARVRDFEQEDKIDILIGQEQGEQGSETPASETPGTEIARDGDPGEWRDAGDCRTAAWSDRP